MVTWAVRYTLPMAPVLRLDDLRTEFHMRTGSVVAVDGVSFDVDEGECVGVVGESGLREEHHRASPSCGSYPTTGT